MYYTILFFITFAVLAQQVHCSPEWNSGSHHTSPSFQYLNYHASPELPAANHHNGLLPDSHQVFAVIIPDLGTNDHEHIGTHSEHITPYHGPIAIPVVLPSGHLADTPEVAVAKLHHLGAVAQAKADKYYSGHAEYGYGSAYGYSGSYHGYGIPVVLPNGHIADTHEVAAAKSAHLLAVAQTKADKYYSGQESYSYGGAYGYSGSHHGYGIPVVLPSGHLADTHEVAAAKAAHMHAVAHAKAEQAHSVYEHDENPHEYLSHETHYITVPHHGVSYYPQYESYYVPQHEPNHQPLPTHSGYFADAQENHHIPVVLETAHPSYHQHHY